MIKFLSNYFKLNTWLVFGFIILLYFLSLTIEFKFIFTDEFYLKSIEGTTNGESVYDFIKADRATEWINYPLAIIVVLVPTTLIAFILTIGVVLKEQKIKFTSLFQVVLKAQMIFAINYLLSTILKWQGIIEKHFDNINNNFDYQSLTYFFRGKELPFWVMYSLQILNVTELLHILFLSYGFSFISKMKYGQALGFVILFYGAALLIWIVFTVFLHTILKG